MMQITRTSIKHHHSLSHSGLADPSRPPVCPSATFHFMSFYSTSPFLHSVETHSHHPVRQSPQLQCRPRSTRSSSELSSNGTHQWVQAAVMAESIGKKKLGIQGLEVSALGLGCMGLAGIFDSNDLIPDENDFNLIHTAYSKGVTFFNTSDAYGPFTSEIVIGKAIKTIPREKLQIATKFGTYFNDPADFMKGLGIRGDPEYVRQACEASLKRLDVDYIDLYYIHRVDGTIPIEVTMGELKKLVEDGKIKYIGLSEAAPDTIRRAHAVHPITAIQIEWSLWTRDIEDELLPLCRELGIGIVPFSPLGKGFFARKASVETLDSTDNRAISTTKIANLEENLGALKVKLTPSDLKEVAEAVPSVDVAGDRFTDAIVSTLGTWEKAVTPPLESWNPQPA